VRAILAQVEARYPVDGGRVFATGISNGAIFSERLGCEMAGQIAAIAPVSGTMAAELAPSCRPARAVSVLQVAGTDDPIMPYAGGAVADFGGRGEGGQVLSVARTFAFWRRLDGCAPPQPAVTLPLIAADDGTRIERTRSGPCRDGARVTLLSIEGGGHTWPGGPQYLPARFVGRASRQLDGSGAILDFFLSTPPRNKRS
jgi:polyhydroxybutyrate depolymerase